MSSEWFRSRKGNLCKKLRNGNFITIFESSEKENGRIVLGYKVVCDGEFLEELYESEDEAAAAAYEWWGDWSDGYND
jgi:hypothetical protein